MTNETANLFLVGAAFIGLWLSLVQEHRTRHPIELQPKLSYSKHESNTNVSDPNGNYASRIIITLQNSSEFPAKDVSFVYRPMTDCPCYPATVEIDPGLSTVTERKSELGFNGKRYYIIDVIPANSRRTITIEEKVSGFPEIGDLSGIGGGGKVLLYNGSLLQVSHDFGDVMELKHLSSVDRKYVPVDYRSHKGDK